MAKVLSYIKYHNQRSEINEARIGSFYNDTLDTNFWTKKEDRSGKSYWHFDQRVRRKLIRIAKDFFEKFDGILRQKDIVDIQLTGSLSNYNYTPQSDLDVHVIVNLDGINDENPKILKSAIDGIRFIWNIRHDIKIRGYDVELYIQDSKEPHAASGLFSLLNNEWIKSPIFDPPEIDENDVNKKADSIAYEINNIQAKLSISPLPKNCRELHKRATKIKEKIHKMRKEALSKGGEFSIGNLAYKKLRNEGYIEKIIGIISDSYDNIYSEK